MENTTTVMPTTGTAGFYATTGGYGYKNDCVADLVLANQIHEVSTNVHQNGTSILQAIAAGDAAIIAATQSQALAGIESTNRNGVAAIEAANRNGVANITATERNGGEGRLITERTAGEIRELINNTSRDNLLAIKDNAVEIIKQGCETRSQEAEHFAAIQLEACKNTSSILSAIDRCCCETRELIRAESSNTRDLINAVNNSTLAAQLADAKLENMILRLSGK